MIRLGIPALLPLIRAEFALDRAQVGMIGSVLNGGAAAAGIPAGPADCGKRWDGTGHVRGARSRQLTLQEPSPGTYTRAPATAKEA